jgi:hypothetical protein
MNQRVKLYLYLTYATDFDRGKHDCAGEVQQQLQTTDHPLVGELIPHAETRNCLAVTTIWPSSV